MGLGLTFPQGSYAQVSIGNPVPPFCVSCWFSINVAAISQMLICFSTSTTSGLVNKFGLNMAANNELSVVHAGAAAQDTDRVTGVAFSLDTMYWACFGLSTITEIRADCSFANSERVVATRQDMSAVVLDRLSLARVGNASSSGNQSYLRGGTLAQVTQYNRMLTDAERALMKQGVHPEEVVGIKAIDSMLDDLGASFPNNPVDRYTRRSWTYGGSPAATPTTLLTPGGPPSHL